MIDCITDTHRISFGKAIRARLAVVALCAAAVCTSVAGAENLFLGATVTDTCVSCPADKFGAPGAVTDGDVASNRNLGAGAPGAFTIVLAKPTALAKVVLLPNMTPNGAVTFEVQTSKDPAGADGTWTSHGGQITGQWADKAPVEVALNPDTVNVRSVKVTVHKSPAWISFYEIEGYSSSNFTIIAIAVLILLAAVGGLVYRRRQANK